MKKTTKRLLPMLLVLLLLATMLLCACGQQRSSQAEDKDGEYTAQTGKKVAVTELYSVDDRIVNEEDDYVIEYSYHVPKLDEDTPGALAINEEIASVYGGLAEKSLKELEEENYTGYADISYETYQNEDVFSLVILCSEYYSGYVTYATYNYDVGAGAWLTNEELLEKKGLTGKEYLTAVRRAAAKDYDDSYFDEWETLCEWFNPGAYEERRASTISERNITIDLPLYSDDRGSLHTVVQIGSHAGADYMNQILTPEFG